MKTLNLIITTKNKKSLLDFFKFFYKIAFVNFNFIKKFFQKNLKKTVITILKSPHVNKISQEQFEIKYISRQLKISTTQVFKFLVFLKKLKISVFPDIKIKIKFVSDNKNKKLLKKKIFNLDNFHDTKKLKTNYKIQNIKLKQRKIVMRHLTQISLHKLNNSKKWLKVLEMYGKN